MPGSKIDTINELRKNILLLQGFKTPSVGKTEVAGLAAIEAAFPNAVFPTGAIHEFLIGSLENAASSGGFITALLSTLMKLGGACLWIGVSRTIFPPGLKVFGIDPERIIFIDLKNERDVLWATEEALKCEGLAAVIAEIREVSFMQSRRLQLAVEQSRVTGFILRNNPRTTNITACIARWKITSLPSELEDGIPGVGYPRWNIELLKVRNGYPGSWKLEWTDGKFMEVAEEISTAILPGQTRKAV